MYGFKGKVREITSKLNAARGHKTNPRDISLRQYLAENFKDANGAGLTPGHMFQELGIDPSRTTADDLMQDDDTKYLLAEIIREGILMGMGLTQRRQLTRMREGAASLMITGEHTGGQRFISPEVFLDPVQRGLVESTYYPDLIIRDIPVGQPTVTVPLLALSDSAMVDSAEGATIEEGSVSYDTKVVTLKKRAKGIKISYEAIRFNTLDLVALYMLDIGRMIGAQLNYDAVGVIVDGDLADGSEAAAVIGVEDTGDGVTWYDIMRVAIRMGRIGRNIGQIFANEASSLLYMNLPEVKNRLVGTPLMQVVIKSGVSLPDSLYVSGQLGTKQVAFSDRSASLVQLTAHPLMLETERIVSKQLEGAYASIYTGFAKVQRNASIVIDGTLAFSSYGFPSWMSPYSGV